VAPPANEPAGPALHPTAAYALKLQLAGRLAEAGAAWTAHLVAHPRDAAALANAGVVALRAGHPAGAVVCFEQLAALQPESAEARALLGRALVRAGRPADAIFHLERAIGLDPSHADAQNDLGVAFERAGDRSSAIRAFERALAIAPAHADAAANLGNARNRRGDTAQAREAFGRALAAQSDHLAARTGMAMSDAIDGDLAGARSRLEAIARATPANPAFWDALGRLRAWDGAFDLAGAAYRQASAQDPADVDARIGVAVALLSGGRYADGFRALEERPDGRFGEARRFPRLPVWSGAQLDGPLLVHCEGSLSDSLQFARFLGDARDRATELVVVADGYWLPLAPLLATVPGVDHVLKDGALVETLRTIPVARAAIQSLGFHLLVTPETLPGRMPYLRAPDDRVHAWRQRLEALHRPRVGLVWSARSDRGALAKHKSVAPPSLAPLLAVPGIAFVSLQAGAMGGLAGFGALAARITDFSREIRDFGDTAAIVDALDLVISVDTSVAHVAGAMGKPVWLLDRFHASWRWHAEAGHSPWYPSLRIFRQHRFLDWSRAVAAAAAALAAFGAVGELPP
jgi:Flp pilus assembly protein TadD